MKLRYNTLTLKFTRHEQAVFAHEAILTLREIMRELSGKNITSEQALSHLLHKSLKGIHDQTIKKD